ncbi:hypothetical protein Tco_1107953 [Tanacetum coccineum]
MISKAYSNRFPRTRSDRVLKLVSTESKKIEKYIRGFPERIKGNITSSKPATLQASTCPTFKDNVRSREPQKDGARGIAYVISHIPIPNSKILKVQGESPEKDLRSLACIKVDEKKLDDIRAHRQLFRSTIPVRPRSEMLELVEPLKDTSREGFYSTKNSTKGTPCSLSKEDNGFDENVYYLQGT